MAELIGWVRFFRRHRLPIVGFPLASAAVVAIALTLLFPADFEATATVVVVPPQFSSSRPSGPISVQGYQRLAESDAIIGETARRLLENRVLDERGPAGLARRLDSRVFASRRANQTALAPVIELRARGSSATEAATIANTWAEAFVDGSGQLFGGSIDRTARLLQDEYMTKQDEIRELELEIAETADEQQRELDDAVRRWDVALHEIQSRWENRLVAHREETQDLVSAYQLETRESLEALVSEHGLTSTPLGAGRDSRRGRVARSGTAAGSRNADRLLARIVVLRVQLAQTPPFLSLERSIDDDALTQALRLDRAEMLEIEALREQIFHSRVPNPLHGDLSLRLAEAEAEFGIMSLDEEMRERMRRVLRAVEELQRRRSAGLSSLEADRDIAYQQMKRAELLELAEARRERRREVDALRRERERRLAELDRRLDQQLARFENLASDYEEAIQAQVGEDHRDVRMGSSAVPSASRRPNRLAFGCTLALFFGAVAGMGVAIVREVEGP